MEIGGVRKKWPKKSGSPGGGGIAFAIVEKCSGAVISL